LSASAVANEFDSDSSNNIATQSMTLSSLSVNKSGTGSGVVTDISGAIDCGSVCSAILLSSQPESLTAFPDAGSTFIGWTGGGCSGTGQCNITLTDQTVTAIFDLAAPDFALSASAPTPATVSPGHSSTSTIELTASGGFNSSVALTCSVSPNPSLTPQCSINPNSAIPGTPATLTVTTTGPQAGLAATSDSGLGTALSIPLSALVLFGIVLGRRQERSRVLKTLSFAAFMAVLSFLPSCGGSSRQHGTPGTPSGSYTIAVMGTSGSTNHSTILTVIVQ
jgi:hypothetical protein